MLDIFLGIKCFCSCLQNYDKKQITKQTNRSFDVTFRSNVTKLSIIETYLALPHKGRRRKTILFAEALGEVLNSSKTGAVGYLGNV